MKTLTKLQINKEKLMNNEELMSLKGGYDGGTIKCYSEGWATGCSGYLGEVTGDCGDWQNACAKGGFTAYCAEC